MLRSFLGETLGNYRVTEKLATGGMGDVYLAEHVLMRKRAVVKVLRVEFSKRTDMLTRFFHEAESAGHIAHPGIVDVYDCGFHDSGVPYMVMEYLEGDTLSDRLKWNTRLDELEARTIVAEVASVLCAAHSAGILHRDIKPSNIFLAIDANSERGETARLLDFGIAKLAEEYRTGEVTEAGVFIGTPPYMAPEQALSASETDARSDVYSLGCVLYHCLCGEAPYDCESFDSYARAHLHDEPERPRARRPELTREIEGIIMKALQKDPVDRYQTMVEFRDALENRLRTIAPLRTASSSGSQPNMIAIQDGESDTHATTKIRAPADRLEPFPSPPAPHPADRGSVREVDAPITQTAPGADANLALGVRVVAHAPSEPELPRLASSARLRPRRTYVLAGLSIAALLAAIGAFALQKGAPAPSSAEIPGVERAPESSATHFVTTTARESEALTPPPDAGADAEMTTSGNGDVEMTSAVREAGASSIRSRGRRRQRETGTKRERETNIDDTPNPFAVEPK